MLNNKYSPLEAQIQDSQIVLESVFETLVLTTILTIMLLFGLLFHSSGIKTSFTSVTSGTIQGSNICTLMGSGQGHGNLTHTPICKQILRSGWSGKNSIPLPQGNNKKQFMGVQQTLL